MADAKPKGDDPMFQAPPAAPFYARVSDVIRDPSIWAELPRADIHDLEGSVIVIHDVMFIQGDKGQRADMDYCVFMFAGPDDGVSQERIGGVQVPTNARTSSTGGGVFVKKLKQLAAYGPQWEGFTSNLPIAGTVMFRPQKAGLDPYVDFQ